jgi:hypothetical protein
MVSIIKCAQILNSLGKKYTFKGQLCTNNFPIQVKIPPHGKEEKEIKLIMKNNRAKYHGMKFKVGIIFLDENSKVNMNELLIAESVLVINKEKIIWSDDLTIE